jgi:sulfonate dioxygenase
MSTTTTVVDIAPVAEVQKLSLRAADPSESKPEGKAPEQEYRYAHLLPHFSEDRYPPLEPYEHVDPGHRALQHPNPRSFLDTAERVIEITPQLGTEVRGINLAELDSDGRDQLALEVR